MSMGSNTSLSRAQTVRLVAKWIRDRTPAAAVRFLEGEGRLLVADPADKASIKIAVRKLRRQTGLTFSPPEMLKVKTMVMYALDHADIVGIRPDSGFADEHREWVERITEIYEDRVVQGRQPAHIGRCLLNHDLHKALPKLLHGHRQLSVVSCRNIKPKLESEFGLRNVTQYQIPSQYVMRDVDDKFEARLHDVPIWPTFYRELESRVEVRKTGEVFLVGAGLFGKKLCIDIKEHGGIALDMGSTLDRMASKTTRGPNRPQFRPFPETPKYV
jgi:hypothetical protein